MNATDTNPEATTHPTTSSDGHTGGAHIPLRRPTAGRMLAGVAAGAADYLGVDVTVVRIILVVLTLMGGAGIPLYLAGWLLIPDETSDQSLASEMFQSLPARER
jgi:phage shock protein PspC (stress-responsive transcriptional regulator)